MTPFESWLAEEGVTLVPGKTVFTDPAIYVLPDENDSYTRIFDRVTAETEEEFAAQIAGQKIIVRGKIVQCPQNWGENYTFSDDGLTTS